MQLDGGDSDVTGLVLAGGRSQRMGGREKAFLQIAGVPLLALVTARFAPQTGALVINANGDSSRFSSFGLPVVGDVIEGYAGPLAGLHAGLRWAERETPRARLVASVPVDTPFLPDDLVRRLKAAVIGGNATSAIAASGDRQHPVVGLWPIEIVDEIADALRRDERAMHRFAQAQASAVVEFPFVDIGGSCVDPFFNINTPDDLERAQAVIAQATRTPAPVVGIAGWKNSGKTTLIVRLVEAFTRRGLRVATVKHTHHEPTAGDLTKDSERHAQAGACAVALAGSDRWVMSGRLQAGPVPSLAKIIAQLGPADLVLVEGYKSEPIPKIEVRRLASRDKRLLAATDPNVIAVAADHEIEPGAVPVLALDDIAAIAAFIEIRVGPFGSAAHLRPK